MTPAQSSSATEPRMAAVIDGKALARTIGEDTARQAAALHERTGVLPTLAVVLARSAFTSIASSRFSPL